MACAMMVCIGAAKHAANAAASWWARAAVGAAFCLKHCSTEVAYIQLVAQATRSVPDELSARSKLAHGLVPE